MIYTRHLAILLFTATTILNPYVGRAEDSRQQLSVQEIRAVLNSIPPYLPGEEVNAEIDIFGSTSMDALAHGWANGFNRFHPKATVVISAEGSETVFDRLAKTPSSLGMLSRPVTDAELAKLREAGLKQPVAVLVAREGLGVFVHESNPLESITYGQFTALFCAPDAEKASAKLTWSAVGVTGEMADEPIEVIARKERSGTQRFVSDYIFAGQELRQPKATYSSNTEVVQALQDDKNGVAICGLKCGGHSLKLLHLQSNGVTIPCDDHAVLMGSYPLIRPMTLVLDAGRDDEQAKATREFVRYAMHQAGQSQDILAGFFPFDPPTLRGELAKLAPQGVETGK